MDDIKEFQRFQVWEPENCTEDDAQTITIPQRLVFIDAYTTERNAEHAAERYAEQSFSDDPWYDETDVNVRAESGELFEFVVEPRPEISFYVNRKTP